MRTLKRALWGMLSLTLIGSGASAAQWDLDKVHSHVGFTARHMMVSNVRGEFTEYDAAIELDPKDPTKLSINATINVNSITTRNEQRDGHLKSPDFFDAANHPTITFKSKKVTKVADGKFKVAGDLTMRGTTKEITLDVEGLTNTINDPYGNIRTGATATTKINRQDYGLAFNAVMEAGGLVVSDDITINLEIELIQKK